MVMTERAPGGKQITGSAQRVWSIWLDDSTCFDLKKKKLYWYKKMTA